MFVMISMWIENVSDGNMTLEQDQNDIFENLHDHIFGLRFLWKRNSNTRLHNCMLTSMLSPRQIYLKMQAYF